MRRPPRSLRHRAFTLTELLIAVAIISVLVVVAVPTYNAAVANTVLHVDAQELANVANDAQSIAAGFAQTMPTESLVIQALHDMQPLKKTVAWSGVATSATEMYPSTAFGMVSYDVTDNPNLAGYAMQTENGDCVLALTTSGQTVSWIYNYNLVYCDGSIALAGPNQPNPPGTNGAPSGAVSATTAPATTTTTAQDTSTTIPATTTTTVPSSTSPIDAPTNVVATGGDSIAVVSWAVIPSSDDGGSPITSYTATAIDGADDNYTCVTVLSGGVVPTSCTIAGLTNGVTYTVTVVGLNINGSSPSSLPATVVPSTVPGPPTGLSATGANNVTAFTESWNAPSANGASISDYELRYSTDNVNWTVVDTNSLTLTHLQSVPSQATYYVQIAAVNAVGQGAWSAKDTVLWTPTTSYQSPNYGYSCNAGDSLSGSTCTTTMSYGASYGVVSYSPNFGYSCPNGGTLNGGSCITQNTYSANYQNEYSSCSGGYSYPITPYHYNDCWVFESGYGTQAACQRVGFMWSTDPSEGTHAQCYLNLNGGGYSWPTSYWCNAGDTLYGTTCVTGLGDTYPTASSYPPTSEVFGEPSTWPWSCSGTQSADECSTTVITGSPGSTLTGASYAVVSYTPSYGYYCPSGSSLIGTTCTTTSNYGASYGVVSYSTLWNYAFRG